MRTLAADRLVYHDCTTTTMGMGTALRYRLTTAFG